MKHLTLILTVYLLTITIFSCVQTQVIKPAQKIKVLAKFLSDEGGDKVLISKFLVIKVFSDTTLFSDTIFVGYYFYKTNKQKFDTVLLTLNKYDGKTTIKNYFTCPDYDAKIGIQKAKINFIDIDYWEGCETGKGDCKPLTFTRCKQEKKWFLIMPCGGTETSVKISGIDNSFKKQLHLFHNNCPPYIELTDLADGRYSAYMTACGLGGQVKFNLKTN